jgi:putative tryptophan/tyrosine transport system substrate-binding protein
MRRREFITLLGGAAAWPLAARAQQPAMPVIGFLDATTAADSLYRVSAFRDGLKEAGFIDGHNVAIEFRWAENKLDRLPALAADLAQRQVAVIVGPNTAVRIARAATSTIPIVFVSGGDPLAVGLVTNLSRPGGNITGVSFASSPLQPKRLALLHELVPPPATIAWWRQPGATGFEMEEKEVVPAAARELGRHLLVLNAQSAREIDAAFATIVQSRAGALLVGSDILFNNRRRQVAALAARHGVPVASGFVASLARPGGYVTGLSVQAPDLAGKRVELLREVLPGLRGLAIMGDAAYAAAVLEMGEVEVAARKLGLDTARVEIRRGEDIAPAIAALKGHADALYACAGALVVSNTTRISSLASTARLPTIYPSRPYLAGGGFMSYGPNYPDLFRRAAEDGRQNFAWSQAGRHPGRAADQV